MATKSTISKQMAPTLPQRPTPVNTPINKWLTRTYDVVDVLNEDRLERDDRPRGMVWAGEFTSSGGYAVGDMVLVTTSGSFSITGSTIATYNQLPGVYLCIEHVPPLIDTSGITGNTLTTIAQYQRPTDVLFEPVYPTSSPQYWQLITLLPTSMNVCVNGVTKAYYVNAQPVTGSS